MSNHPEFEQLPKISRQVDTDTYLTADGDRISVREYEARKDAIEQGPVVDASDGAHLARNAEAEKEVTGHTTEDGLKPEKHPSATVAVEGRPGERRRADKFGADVANEGDIENAEANETDETRAQQIQESTPAMTVTKTGTSVEDQNGDNKAYETVAADTDHVMVPKNVTANTDQESKVNEDALAENSTVGDRENDMARPDGSLHPVAEEPRKDASHVSQVEETKVVKPKNQKNNDKPHTDPVFAGSADGREENSDNNAANDAIKNAKKEADVK